MYNAYYKHDKYTYLGCTIKKSIYIDQCYLLNKLQVLID
jgi:hypothetical protein